MKPQPRCFLFVPADDQRKLAKVLGCGADAVIIDLEDSVATDKKAAARKMAKQFLSAHIWNKRRPRLYVRINDLTTGLAQDDLAAVIPESPDGVMLPKANSGSDVAVAGSMIDSLAGKNGAEIGIVAIATETPLALLQMHSFVGPHPRLEGLTWGSEDLGTALGAATARDASGRLTGPFALARNLCLVAAHAAGVQPIDSIYADFRDEPGLTSEAAEAARDGFTGKMAIHPAQIAAINAAFTPKPEALAEAEAIVKAFEANPAAGAIGLAGKMIDRPHLIRAQRLLARARPPA
ncbi:MAG TPA: CoA ester lyase [Hyphomicrobiales bacterium]|jgi:citrate lyase subunit beta/citryl-CoA lyase